MTLCTCLHPDGPWANSDQFGIPPGYMKTLRAGCSVHGDKDPEPEAQEPAPAPLVVLGQSRLL